MKRIILFATLMLISISSFAQLNVQSKSDALQTICSLRTGLLKAYYYKGVYSVDIPSTNQFDEGGSFYLGRDKESALQTLDDLIHFADTAENGESVTAKDALDKEWLIIKRVELGVSCLDFSHEPQAGIRTLMKKEMVKIRKKISEIY